MSMYISSSGSSRRWRRRSRVPTAGGAIDPAPRRWRWRPTWWWSTSSGPSPAWRWRASSGWTGRGTPRAGSCRPRTAVAWHTLSLYSQEVVRLEQNLDITVERKRSERFSDNSPLSRLPLWMWGAKTREYLPSDLGSSEGISQMETWLSSASPGRSILTLLGYKPDSLQYWERPRSRHCIFVDCINILISFSDIEYKLFSPNISFYQIISE